MTDRPPMLRLYVSDAHAGDGFRTGFVLAEKAESATLYLPALLATVSVPRDALGRAEAIPYRPRVVRSLLLGRARLYRKYGHRFPRAATVQLLRLLGAGKAAIAETVNTPALPEVLAAKAARTLRAERLAALPAITAAIRQRIEAQPTESPPHAAPRRGARQPHPDQLALGL